MRYRIISTTYGDNVLKHYPSLDRFNVEAVEQLHWRYRNEPPYTDYKYYIEINTIKEFENLMTYLGCIVVDNFASHVDYRSADDPGDYYIEPTIEIYDASREYKDPYDE